VLVKADPARYDELARAKVLEKRTWVAPAFAGGYAYLKDNEGNLVCLDLRTNPGTAGANPAPKAQDP
jgi:hypothetical protein